MYFQPYSIRLNHFQRIYVWFHIPLKWKLFNPDKLSIKCYRCLFKSNTDAKIKVNWIDDMCIMFRHLEIRKWRRGKSNICSVESTPGIGYGVWEMRMIIHLNEHASLMETFMYGCCCCCFMRLKCFSVCVTLNMYVLERSGKPDCNT